MSHGISCESVGKYNAGSSSSIGGSDCYWKRPPMSRHYSTIGIGEAFVVHPQLSEHGMNGDPAMAMPSSSSCKATIPVPPLSNDLSFPTKMTSEIVGTIKSIPEDFIVREIGVKAESSIDINGKSIENDSEMECEFENGRLAKLTDFTTLPPLISSRSMTQPQIETGSEVTASGSPVVQRHSLCETHEPSKNPDEDREVHYNSNNLKLDDDHGSSNASVMKNEQKRCTSDNHITILKNILIDSLLPLPSSQQGLLNENQHNVCAKSQNFTRGMSLYSNLQSLHDQALAQLSTFQKSTNIAPVTIKDNIKTSLTIDTLTSSCLPTTTTKTTTTTTNVTTTKKTLTEIIIPPILDDDIHETITINPDSIDKPSFSTTSSQAPISELSTSSQKKKSCWKRGLFHRTLKLAFPLLKSHTLTQEQSNNYIKMELYSSQNTNSFDNDIGKSYLRCVEVGKDTTFHTLIPYLSSPRTDLFALYTYCSRGCVISKSNGYNRRKKNSKPFRNGKHKNDRKRPWEAPPPSNNINNPMQLLDEVVLRLKPNLGKEERRNVHHLIAKAFRDFQTDTKTGVPLSDSTSIDDNGSNDTCLGKTEGVTTTSGIVVRWSVQAQRNLLKRQRSGHPISHTIRQGHAPVSTDTYLCCVLKKRNLEHMIAVQSLVSAMNCRTSDVGLAGIKDMRAITYQFCTLRNVSPLKAIKANAVLAERGGKVQVGNFRWVDRNLNQGDLRGNNFEIIVRNLKRVRNRVKKEVSSNGDLTQECKKDEYTQHNNSIADHANVLEESFHPCDATHIHAMVERVRKYGFINYYGEQRIGDCGRNDEVGVRSMDIGKAMLKSDFAEAIHLLMKGRQKGRDGALIEGPDIRRVRDTWVESNGDVDLTLASFLKKGNSMARERVVLKGLKRYGKEKPLEAIKCLHYNVRLFWINAYQSYVWNKMATERILRFGSSPVQGDLYVLPGDKKNEVRILSEPCSVKITDIVLPLPGYNMQYPTNKIGDLYKQYLEQEGIFFERGAVLEATAKGSYRHLIRIPHSMDWEVIDSFNIEKSEFIEAVKFKFSLDSGSYATMLLRELMVSTISR